MSDWSRPSEQLELRELSRELNPARAFHRRCYSLAFLAGVMLVCILGFSTSLFDSGPTDLDVSAAYREGIDRGTVSAQAAWEERLETAWWEEYLRGKGEGSSLAPTLAEAVRDGFSWEGGFEAGLQSPDIDPDRSYREGWMQGYARAWTQVTGVSSRATLANGRTGLSSSSVQWFEWEEESWQAGSHSHWSCLSPGAYC